ncbi:hypothetical protein [Geomesophilobacter sediminis]|uniref:Uncharacterized protein n=1 Tax=Geomesophilobacter sediminis TaxID=2798584 RepID=A0A8J7S847_9BACT|nr:hypothetical protein [Geomesophilobacter sediminis]MBJ6727357.1 hypothetical protein [Geomesophilobacter sediminis]
MEQAEALGSFSAETPRYLRKSHQLAEVRQGGSWTQGRLAKQKADPVGTGSAFTWGLAKVDLFLLVQVGLSIGPVLSEDGYYGHCGECCQGEFKWVGHGAPPELLIAWRRLMLDLCHYVKHVFIAGYSIHSPMSLFIQSTAMRKQNSEVIS